VSKAALKFAPAQGKAKPKWPDGTRRSQGNDFTGHLVDRPSIFASPKDQQAAAARSSSTAAVEAMRSKGIEPAMVYGLSRHSEEAKRTRGRPAAVKVARA
jgi:hypothetical protein